MVLKKLIKIIFLDHYLFINLFPIFYFYIHNKKINAQVHVEYVSGMRLQMKQDSHETSRINQL